MKFEFAVIAVVLSSLPALSQTPPSRAEIVQRYCHASEVTHGPEVDRINAIESRLSPVLGRLQGPRIYVVVVDSNVINAWNNNLSPKESLICIPVGMVRFMGGSEGEMAFILAHETGHALDAVCKSNEGRAGITPPSLGGALNKLFGGSGRDPLAEQRACETRADTIGFELFTRAGYNPYDAAGAFGRLEMFLGDTSTGILARFTALGSDHPMTPERIANMRTLLNSQ